MEQQHYKWHQASLDAVLQEQNTNAACGLSHKAARSRYRKGGPNTLFDAQKESELLFWGRFFKDPSLILFLSVCLLAIFFSEIGAALAALGFFLAGCLLLWLIRNQQQKDEKRIDAFRMPSVAVLREGKKRIISARRVVPGDILFLEKGDIVPCDCRLLEAQNLFVNTLMPNPNGAPAWIRQSKRADLCYPYGASVFAPFCENMLYGGSQILQGYALAIAVEIGERTFLGAMEGFAIPSDGDAGGKNQTLAGLRKWLRLYSLLQYFLLIPMALLGVFFAPEGQGILHILLSLSALFAVSSQSFLTLLFQIVIRQTAHDCFFAFPRENKTLIKSETAVEKLSEVTDLIVLGHGGISDSKKHLLRCATGSGVLSLKEDSGFSLESLCEALLIRQRAQKNPVDLENNEPASDLVLRELLQHCNFDEEALDVRLVSADSVSSEKGRQILFVKTKESAFSLHFSEKVALLDLCDAYDDCGTARFFSPEQKSALHRFSASALCDGCELLFVSKQVGNRLIFLGVLAIREEIQSVLPSVLEEYRQSKVRVSFFLFGDPSAEEDYARTAKLPSSVCRKSEDPSVSLWDSFGKRRVFLGYSGQEVLTLIRTLRKQGSVVAVLGDRFEDLALLRAASVSIACLSMPEKEASIFAGELSGPSVIRRYADILVSQASRFGGGLAALLQALASCRSTQRKNRSVFQFLFFSQIFRWVLLFLGLCVGVGAPSGTLLMQVGWLLELLSVLWLSSLSLPQKRLRRSLPFAFEEMEKTMLFGAVWISVLASGLLFAALTVFLSLIGFWNDNDGIVFLAYTLLIFSLSTAYRFALPCVERISGKAFVLPLLWFALLAAGNCLVAIFFPSAAIFVGLPLWSKKAPAFLLLVPVAFWILFFLFSKKKKRTAK